MPILGLQLEIQRCPYCGVNLPSMRMCAQFDTMDYAQRNRRYWMAYGCSRCGGVVIAWSEQPMQEIKAQFPTSPAYDDPATPERARNYLAQAIDSLHAPAGAVMLAASAVDAMLKAKALKDGTLYSRIDAAVKSHLITEGMGKWAHEVRLDANDQRHADENAPMPTQQDAERVIEFAKALGMFLFTLPAMVESGLKAAMPTVIKK